MKKKFTRLIASFLALMMAVSCLPLAVWAADGGGGEPVNLARDRPVYASGSEHPPVQAVDGNEETHWGGSQMKNSGGQPTADNAVSWFVVDLGEDVDTITGISMKYNALVWPTSCKVQAAVNGAVSFDGYTTPDGTAMKHTSDYENTQNAIDAEGWTDIAAFTKESSGERNILQTVEESALVGIPEGVRYIRVYFTGINTNAGGTCIGMKELTVMGARKTSYTVTFVNEGITVGTAEVLDGGTAVMPEEPAKEGSIFKGWFDEGGNEFTALTPVTGDITVTAKWEAPDPADPPAPGEGQMWAYLGFGENWGIGSQSFALKLYKLDEGILSVPTPSAYDRKGTVVDSVEDGGLYLIGAPTVIGEGPDSWYPCLMHCDAGNGHTSWCRASNNMSAANDPYGGPMVSKLTTCGFNHVFRLHMTEDGCWLIESAANGGKYLSIGEGSGKLNEYAGLPFGNADGAAKFVITADKAERSKFTVAAIVDEPGQEPEPGTGRTLEQAIADETTEVHYLTATGSNGGGWTSTTDKVSVQLYGLSNPTETVGSGSTVEAAASVENGAAYAIRSQDYDGSTWRIMHCGDAWAHTNQCGAGNPPTSLGGCGNAHLFIFAKQADGTYTIKSAARSGNGYLTQMPTDPKPALNGSVRDEFDLADEAGAAKFGVTAAEEAGAYYIWWETEKAVVADNLYTPEKAVGEGKTVRYLSFTGGTNSSRWWDAASVAGDTAKIHLYKAAGTETSSAISLDTDGVEAGNYVIVFGLESTRPAVMHRSDSATNQCDRSTETVLDLLHLFTFAKPEGSEWSNAFTIAAQNDAAKFLSLDQAASGSQRAFRDTAVTFYVNPVNAEDNDGSYYIWIALDPVDYSTWEKAGTEFSGTTAGEPFSTDDVGTQMFRIPSIITLSNGWLVAAADVRWAGYLDNPANLDTIVSVSKDGGATWNWEVVNYFGDYANNVTNSLSAAFIDPALVQANDGKVWLAIDVTAADGKSTAGSTGFDSQNRILVAHAPQYVGAKAPTDPSLYTYYVSKTGTNYVVDGESITLYPIESSNGAADSNGVYVDAFMNLYQVKDGAPVKMWCKQEGAEKAVQNNLFYKQSPWKVFPTCFIMLRSAAVTDSGLEWDDPIFPNLRYEGQTQPFFGVCPGRGFLGDNGRITFTTYDNATGEKASIIYSDDNGATWQRGNRSVIGYGGKTSESQIIRLPDGTLRMYSRNSGGSRNASYADSTDGGVTWSATQADTGLQHGSNCMYSVINVAGALKGPNGERYENVVMASYPEGNGGASEWGNRSNGSLRVGYISGSTAEGWTVNWLGTPYLYHGEAGTYFAYSCLTQFGAKDAPQDKFCVLYEPNDNSSARPNLPVDIWYKEFNVAEVLGEGWYLSFGSEEGALRVTDANDQEIAAVDNAYTIPAGGKIYVDGRLTATIPMGVANVVVDGEQAKTLAVADNGAMAVSGEGNVINLPDDSTAAALTMAGSVGTAAAYAVTDAGKLVVSGSELDGNYYNPKAPWLAEKDSITELVVAEGMTAISGYYTFTGMDHLTKVTLPTTLTSMAVYTFQNCTALTSIAIPEGVTELQTHIFEGCTALTTVILPSTLTTIRAQAFQNCTALTTIGGAEGVVAIPDSVGLLYNSAFENCTSIRSLILPATDVFYDPDGGFNSSGVFRGCSSLASVVLPEGTIHIPSETFKGCTSLEHIRIPSTVTEIGGNAFGGCTALQSVTFPAGLNIGKFNDYSLTTRPFYGANPVAAIYEGDVSSGNMLLNFSAMKRIRYMAEVGYGKALSSGLNSNTYNAVLAGGSIPADAVFEEGRLITPVKEGCMFLGWKDEDAGTLLAKDAGANTYTIPDTAAAGATYTAQWVTELDVAVEDLWPIEIVCEHGVDDRLAELPTPAGDLLEVSDPMANTVYEADAYPWVCEVSLKGSVEFYQAQLDALQTGEPHQYVIEDLPVLRYYWDGQQWVRPADEAAHEGAGFAESGALQVRLGCTIATYAVTIDGTEYTMRHGDKLGARLPAAPAREGYTFGGWFAGEARVDADTEVTGAMTIVSQWIRNTYTVTFTSEGMDESTATVNHGDTLGEKLPTPTREGYRFDGWFNGETQFTAETQVTGDITLTAKWTEIVVAPTTYTVTFTGEGVDESTVTVNDGETLGDKLPTPTREGYRFDGWFNGETQFTAETLVTGDITLTAKWTEIVVAPTTYTVTFTGEGVDESTVTVEEGSTIELPTPERPGYTFNGWFNGDTQFTADTEVDGNITLTARWTRNAAQGGGVWIPVMPNIPDDPDDPNENVDDPDVPLANLPFVDVDKEIWYAPSVAYVYSKGYMKGNGDLTFTPEEALTRGMMAQVIHNIAQNPGAIGEAAFTDLGGRYYAEAVVWGAASGILKGYSSETYGGERDVTRQEMVTMLYRYAQSENLAGEVDLSVLDSFTDADLVAGWAKEAMAWAVENGLIEGRGNDDIDPQANITRAEVAAVLERYGRLFLA